MLDCPITLNCERHGFVAFIEDKFLQFLALREAIGKPSASPSRCSWMRRTRLFVTPT